MVVWYTALLHPDRINGVMGMSVPYGGRAKQAPLESFKAAFGDNFFYILYHNELDGNNQGVAEAEYDQDPQGILSRLYASPDSPRAPALITDPKRRAGGWIDRLGEVLEQPAWLSEDDLAYFVNEFKGSGFRGGVNYYRNFDRNWTITESCGPRHHHAVGLRLWRAGCCHPRRRYRRIAGHDVAGHGSSWATSPSLMAWVIGFSKKPQLKPMPRSSNF